MRRRSRSATPSRAGWYVADLVEEAGRRLRVRDLIVAAVCAALAAGIVLLNGLDLQRAIASNRDQLAAGVTVFSVEPEDPQTKGLDPRACARMTRSSSVLAAGAVKGEAVSVDARWSPSGVPVVVWDLTPEALRVWWPDMPAAGGLFAGHDLGQQIGLAPGVSVEIDGRLVEIEAVLPETVRPATWQATVVRTVPAVGRGGWECWFRVGHGGIASAPEIAATAFPGDRYTLRPFFRTDELSVSPMTLLRDGRGPWSWMAALSIAVVLQLIVSLTGRAEAGVYRATGTRLSELWFMSLVRTVMIGAGATALGAMAAAVWLALQPANVISAAGLWYALQPVVLFATGLLVVLPALDTLSVAGSVADRLTA